MLIILLVLRHYSNSRLWNSIVLTHTHPKLLQPIHFRLAAHKQWRALVQALGNLVEYCIRPVRRIASRLLRDECNRIRFIQNLVPSGDFAVGRYKNIPPRSESDENLPPVNRYSGFISRSSLFGLAPLQILALPSGNEL